MKSTKPFYIFCFLLLSAHTVVNADDPEYFLRTSGNRPFGIAFDNKGLLYMVTAPATGNGTLSKVSPDGKITELVTLEGSFIGPGICINNDDILITVGDKLLKITPYGKKKILTDGFSRCFDVKVDNNENIYVADDLVNTIYKITPSGEKAIFYRGDTPGSFTLTGLAFDSKKENLFVRQGNRILKFNINTDAITVKPEVVIDDTKMFYLCSGKNDNLYASTIDNVIKIEANGAVQILSQKPLMTSIGIAQGGKGFDENSLYVAVIDGIIILPVK